MRAVGFNGAFAHHHDFIGKWRHAQPVGNGDHSNVALRGEASQGSQQRGLGAAIEGGSAFIQNQDLRSAHQGACQSYALTFAAGELRALFAHKCVEAVRELLE